MIDKERLEATYTDELIMMISGFNGGWFLH